MEPTGLFAQQMPEDVHEWLRFGRPGAMFNSYSEKYLKISGKQFLCPRMPDWDPLDQAGVGDEIRRYLTSQYDTDSDEGHIDHNDWVNFFSLWHPIYRELCLEFLCTARIVEKGTQSATDRNFLQFRLGGEDRQMSYRDIAVSLGIYTEDEISSVYFNDFLISGAKINKLSSSPWSQLSTKPYVTSLNKITEVTNVNLRVIQRFLSHTITQRDENTERLNLQDMWYLEKFDEHELINIPHCVAWYLVKKAVGRQGNSPISGGHYITAFAHFFGVDLTGLTRVRDPLLQVGEAMYISCRAIKRAGNSFIAWPVGEASSSHQGPRTDDGPLDMEVDEEREQGHEQGHEQAEPSLHTIMQGIRNIQVSNNEFRADFHDFRDEMRYRMGNLEYRTDWTAGNVSWMAEQHGYQTTYAQPIYQWGTPESTHHPPPVYDHSAAMEEARRRHQEEYEQNLQQEWQQHGTQSDWTAWPTEEEIRRRQEDHHHSSSQGWPF